MNAFWSYFWPLVAAGLVIGAIAGSVAFRRPRAQATDRLAGEQLIAREQRHKPRLALALALGAVAAVGAAALWSGPMGAADRLVHRVERDARVTLDNYEMPNVGAHLHRGPLSRCLILAGPADDFQQGELARILGSIPGVREARWTSDGGGIPLIVESAAAAILGFLFGLLLAYLVELRRRHNAQWNW